jgi:hypothetical protein
MVKMDKKDDSRTGSDLDAKEQRLTRREALKRIALASGLAAAAVAGARLLFNKEGKRTADQLAYYNTYDNSYSNAYYNSYNNAYSNAYYNSYNNAYNNAYYNTYNNSYDNAYSNSR